MQSTVLGKQVGFRSCQSSARAPSWPASPSFDTILLSQVLRDKSVNDLPSSAAGTIQTTFKYLFVLSTALPEPDSQVFPSSVCVSVREQCMDGTGRSHCSRDRSSLLVRPSSAMGTCRSPGSCWCHLWHGQRQRVMPALLLVLLRHRAAPAGRGDRGCLKAISVPCRLCPPCATQSSLRGRVRGRSAQLKRELHSLAEESVSSLWPVGKLKDRLTVLVEHQNSKVPLQLREQHWEPRHAAPQRKRLDFNFSALKIP